jgi:hypothetical protein
MKFSAKVGSSEATLTTLMPKIRSQKSPTKQEKIRDYRRQRLALIGSKPVSKEEAMAQILLYSKEPRKNVYASMRLTEDGKLILINSQKLKVTGDKLAEETSTMCIFPNRSNGS